MLVNHFPDSALQNRLWMAVVWDVLKNEGPVMIAAASPINGMDKEKINVRDTSLVSFLTLTYRKNVKTTACINANWPDYAGFTVL
jgi:hypothetical protein